MTGFKTDLNRIVKTKKFAVVVASTVSASGGAVGGYFLAVKLLTDKFDARYAKEVSAARKVYAARNKTDEFSDPTSLAEKYLQEKHGVDPQPEDDSEFEEGDEPDTDMVAKAAEILGKNQYVSYDKIGGTQTEVDILVDEEQVEVVTVKSNVFNTYPVDIDQTEFEFDEAAEALKREAQMPYIVAEEDFLGHESGEEEQLTFYEKDGTLATESDVPVQNIQGILGGEENLRFGYGSGDKNIVYIHNPKLDAWYEVVRSTGSFSEEKYVIRHSEDSSQSYRFRGGED